MFLLSLMVVLYTRNVVIKVMNISSVMYIFKAPESFNRTFYNYFIREQLNGLM